MGRPRAQHQRRARLRRQLQSSRRGHVQPAAVGDHRRDRRAPRRQVDRPQPAHVIRRIDEDRLPKKDAAIVGRQALEKRPAASTDPDDACPTTTCGSKAPARQVQQDAQRGYPAGSVGETEPVTKPFMDTGRHRQGVVARHRGGQAGLVISPTPVLDGRNGLPELCQSLRFHGPTSHFCRVLLGYPSGPPRQVHSPHEQLE